MLWQTSGVMLVLLQELVSIYPHLPAIHALSTEEANRVCNALALLQCVAVHTRTRHLFLDAHMPLYLYPFLKTQHQTRSYEYLRLSSLGVIGALVRTDSIRVIHFLVNTEIIPLCLSIIRSGSELSMTVATFIINKILTDNNGFEYLTETNDRTYALLDVLSFAIDKIISSPSIRLLKHVMRCYVRLSEDGNTKRLMRTCFPDNMSSRAICQLSCLDPMVRRWLEKLLTGMRKPIPLEIMAGFNPMDMSPVTPHNHRHGFHQHDPNQNGSDDMASPQYVDVNMTTYANMTLLFGLHDFYNQ